MSRDTYNTTMNRDAIIRMFLDGTAGEVYYHGRLATVERENDIALVAYGHHILATIDGGNVTLYTANYGEFSETVTKYVAAIGRILNDTETRNVRVVESVTPTLASYSSPWADSAKFIDNYVGDFGEGSRSPVEKDAVAEVTAACKERMATIFG